MDENQKQDSALFPPSPSQGTSLHAPPWLVPPSAFQPGKQNFCTVCKQNHGVWERNEENKRKKITSLRLKGIGNFSLKF